MGLAESVPRFLRHDAQVYKRSIQARDCLLLTYEIWIYRKSVRDSVKAKINPTAPTSKSPVVLLNFDETLEKFFNQTYSIPKIRIEWAYGFYDALAKHKDYIALDEIKKIIDNEMDESCHWHLQAWIAKVKTYLLSISEKEREESGPENHAPNSITRQNLAGALASVTGQRFESKLSGLITEAINVSSVFRAAQVEKGATDEEDVGTSSNGLQPAKSAEVNDQSRTEVIENIEHLFRVVPGENYNPFLCKLVGLYQTIKSNYIDEILTELHKSVDHENQGKRVSAAQLAHAIESVSPTTAVTAEHRTKSARVSSTATPPAVDVHTTLDWIMRPNLGQESTIDSISMEMLVARIAGANLYPTVENF